MRLRLGISWMFLVVALRLSPCNGLPAKPPSLKQQLLSLNKTAPSLLKNRRQLDLWIQDNCDCSADIYLTGGEWKCDQGAQCGRNDVTADSLFCVSNGKGCHNNVMKRCRGGNTGDYCDTDSSCKVGSSCTIFKPAFQFDCSQAMKGVQPVMYDQMSSSAQEAYDAQVQSGLQDGLLTTQAGSQSKLTAQGSCPASKDGKLCSVDVSPYIGQCQCLDAAPTRSPLFAATPARLGGIEGTCSCMVQEGTDAAVEKMDAWLVDTCGFTKEQIDATWKGMSFAEKESLLLVVDGVFLVAGSTVAGAIVLAMAAMPSVTIPIEQVAEYKRLLELKHRARVEAIEARDKAQKAKNSLEEFEADTDRYAEKAVEKVKADLKQAEDQAKHTQGWDRFVKEDKEKLSDLQEKVADKEKYVRDTTEAMEAEVKETKAIAQEAEAELEAAQSEIEAAEVSEDAIQIAEWELRKDGEEEFVEGMVAEIGAPETAGATAVVGAVVMIGTLVTQIAEAICHAGTFPTCQLCSGSPECTERAWALPDGACAEGDADFCLDDWSQVVRAYCPSSAACEFDLACDSNSNLAAQQSGCPTPKGISCEVDADCNDASTEASASPSRYCAVGWGSHKYCYDGAAGDPCSDDSQCASNGFNNYCQNDKCYDGRPHDPCETDQDCSRNYPNNYCIDNPYLFQSGQLCYAGQVNDPCENDDDCRKGRCVNNVCRAGCGGDPCEKDTDCLSNSKDNPRYMVDVEPGGDFACVKNSCMSGGCYEDACENDDQCRGSTYCVDNPYVGQTGKLCYAGRVNDPCDDDGDCNVQGNYCHFNRCYAGADGDPCDMDSDCERSGNYCDNNPYVGQSGYTCLDGSINDPCSVDTDCARKGNHCGDNPFVGQTGYSCLEGLQIGALPTITLASLQTGKLCSDDNEDSESADVICNRDAEGAWEEFQLFKYGEYMTESDPLFSVDGGIIALMGGHYGKWCSDDGNAGVICNRDEIGEWEKFELHYVDTSSCNLQEGHDAVPGTASIASLTDKASAAACCDACRANEKCGSFVFKPSNGNCWLLGKDYSGDATPAEDRIFGSPSTAESPQGTIVALKGGKNGKWCADKGDDGMTCASEAVGTPEMFTLKDEGITTCINTIVSHGLRYSDDCKKSYVDNEEHPAGRYRTTLSSTWTNCYRDECATSPYSNRDDLIKADCACRGMKWSSEYYDCGDYYFQGECIAI